MCGSIYIYIYIILAIVNFKYIIKLSILLRHSYKINFLIFLCNFFIYSTHHLYKKKMTITYIKKRWWTTWKTSCINLVNKLYPLLTIMFTRICLPITTFFPPYHQLNNCLYDWHDTITASDGAFMRSQIMSSTTTLKHICIV